MSETPHSPADDAEAIDRYDRAGGCDARFLPVRWPDLVLSEDNIWNIVEGVVGSRMDFAREVFGPDLDTEGLAERLEQAWRREALQLRFAPEGVYARARCAVRVWLLDDEGAEEAEDTLALEVELCLSFSTRRHARPFVDFMRGRLSRASDGAAREIDPFAMMIEPQAAVAWSLNGVKA